MCHWVSLPRRSYGLGRGICLFVGSAFQFGFYRQNLALRVPWHIPRAVELDSECFSFFGNNANKLQNRRLSSFLIKCIWITHLFLGKESSFYRRSKINKYTRRLLKTRRGRLDITLWPYETASLPNVDYRRTILLLDEICSKRLLNVTCPCMINKLIARCRSNYCLSFYLPPKPLSNLFDEYYF